MKQVLNYILAVGFLMLGAGCASQSGGDSSTATGTTPITTIPTSTAPTPPPGSTSTGANTVTLTVLGGSQASQAELLGQFFFDSPVISPTNIQFTMNTQVSSGTYPGSITLSFDDVNGARSATLSTTHPTSGVEDSSDNIWFKSNGNWYFHGFFQDLYGAVVVVVDSSDGLGDGSSEMGGRIYFQNFASGYPNNPNQGPNLLCWGIQIGPYDCRTFIVGGTGENGVVQSNSAIYPNNSGDDRPAYTELGTFVGLDRQSAMGD